MASIPFFSLFTTTSLLSLTLPLPLVSLCLFRFDQTNAKWQVAAVKALATHSHAPTDIGAAIASGSFRSRGMIVAPC